MLIDKEILIVSPSTVLKRLFELLKTSEFWKSIGFTFFRISFGYLLGVLFGTALAVLTSVVPFFKTLFYPIISLVKATPVVSFIILALVWIKKNGVPVFITFLIVLPIIWANVSEGLNNTDRSMLEMAKV
ncbi:MAG: nitrate ABC transporter permease, partial [Clostridia bacterium]|nr:nitrate ABC transporter permease [Clostridia bacterium]